MLFLSVHTLRRMTQRGITRQEIREGLTNRETLYVSADDATCTVILCVTDAGRRLKMVVASDDHECIITVAARDEEE